MGKKDDKFWLDDPEWERLLRKSHKKPISSNLKRRIAEQKHQPRTGPAKPEPETKTTSKDADKDVVVNFSFSIPKLANIKKAARKNKSKIIKAASAAVFVIGVFGAFQFISGRKLTELPKNSADSKGQAGAEFSPLIPLKNPTVTEENQSQAEPEFKYERDRKVMAFTTEYNGSNLTVSQQALPDQLKTNPGQVEGIARSVNATVPIETQKGKAYIGTDEETKTQIAVFATEEVLVFIRSTEKIDPDMWEYYINQLIPKQEKIN